MLNFLKAKRKIIILLIAITTLGAFLRFYDFFDLLLFEVDQARDYNLIGQILTGNFSEFPLVGPKAGGTFFRLGALYYLPALFFAFAFGLSPHILALPEVLLSVAVIPLFFIFLREFFNEKISLRLTFLWAISLFFVEYAHFSWNPNYIPFFFILTLYATLRYSRDERRRVLWLTIMALSGGFLMQLHTVTLVAVPLIWGIYFIFQKKKIIWKHWVIFWAVMGIMFSPLILNDLLTKGENIKEFQKAFVSRSTRDENPTLSKSVFMNIYNTTRNYSIILTSQNYVKDLKRVDSSENLRELIVQNKSEINSVAAFLFFGFAFGAGLVLIVFSILKTKEEWKRNFLVLIFITQAVFFLIFMPLALRMDSRYFFPVAIMPFVFLGMIFEFMEKTFWRGKFLAGIFFVLLIFLNLKGNFQWLRLLESYQYRDATNEEFILDKYFIITMAQWEGIVDKIMDISANQSKNLYVDSTPFHTRPLIYLLEMGEKKPVRNINLENLDPEGIYFALRESQDVASGRKLPESISKKFEIKNRYNFGSVTLFELRLKSFAGLTKKEKFDLMKESKFPKCYELNYDIEARNKCLVEDISYLFSFKK